MMRPKSVYFNFKRDDESTRLHVSFCFGKIVILMNKYRYCETLPNTNTFV